MSFLPMLDYEDAGPEAREAWDGHTAHTGRITNMKRTLLKNPAAFRAYMEWYALKDQITPFTGERGLVIFAHAISTGNQCLICSTFFRKILIDAGEDPDRLVLNADEKLLADFGLAIARNPHGIGGEIYDALKERYDDGQILLLVAFAGIMAATNLFNTVAKVPLDEVLYGYTKKEG